MLIALGSFCLAGLAGCGPADAAGPGASFSANPNHLTTQNDSAVLHFNAWDEQGAPADGSVTFSTSVGSLAEGNSVVLVGGQAVVTYRCSPSLDPHCAGQASVGATWNKLDRHVTVELY